jgi:hypothetical protein
MEDQQGHRWSHLAHLSRQGKVKQMKELTMTADEELVLEPAILQEAGLQGRLRILISSGEIRILPMPPEMMTPEALVENLASCLGQESAAAYDFDLKLGGLYEAR